MAVPGVVCATWNLRTRQLELARLELELAHLELELARLDLLEFSYRTTIV